MTDPDRFSDEPPVDDRTPPQDLDAERSVLGGMLLSKDAIGDVTSVLDREDFYRPAHTAVFDCIIDINGRGEPVDPITVAAELERRNELVRVGGAPYLHTLVATVPTASNAGYYADIVAEKAVQRRLVEVGMRIATLGYSGTGGAEMHEVVDRARAAVDNATASYRNRNHEEGAWIGDLAESALRRYAEPRPPALSTGWADVDDILSGGLRPGQLVVIGARTGVGKSVVGINLAVQAALAGQGVVFASLEMHRDEITDRVLAQVASVELGALTRHHLSPDDWHRIEQAAQQLQDVPLRIEDASSLSLSRLRSLARDQKRHQAGLGLVVADYLQLLNGADPRVPRHEQVAQFSRELKLLAKELGVPVVALSQLNRQSEQATDKRPTKAHLRESGAVEQDADVIALLWLDPSEEHHGEIAFIVDKNRQGRCGDIYLQWAPHYARARDLYSVSRSA
jgi:replicative DNA helicase